MSLDSGENALAILEGYDALGRLRTRINNSDYQQKVQYKGQIVAVKQGNFSGEIVSAVCRPAGDSGSDE